MCVVPFFFSASSSSSCFPLAYFLFRLPLLQTRKNTACGKLIRSAATRRPVADTSQSPSTGGVSPPPRGRFVCVCVPLLSLRLNFAAARRVLVGVYRCRKRKFLSPKSHNEQRAASYASSERRRAARRGRLANGEPSCCCCCVCVCVCVCVWSLVSLYTCSTLDMVSLVSHMWIWRI